MGGNSMRAQVNVLRKDPQFLICTPGRLKDCTERGLINLSVINNVVLDEVDRMLDMGFIFDIKFIINKLKKERQSLFFSATMNRKSEEIANTLLTNPIKIEIETQGPGKNVDQDIIRVDVGKNKIDELSFLLKKTNLKKF
jgi:ATP-dependent RNA helicase RhlE